MALIELAAPFSHIRGSIAGTTFANSRGGLTARSKNTQPKKVVKNGVPQQQYIQFITRYWREMSEGARNSWNDNAIANNVPQRKNRTLFLSGYEQYLQATLNATTINAEYTFPSPNDYNPTNIHSLILEADSLTHGLKVTYSIIPTGSVYCALLSFSSQLAGVKTSPINKFRLLTTSNSTSGAIVNLSTEYTDIFGELVQGRTIQCQCILIDLGSYFFSDKKTCSTIVL